MKNKHLILTSFNYLKKKRWGGEFAAFNIQDFERLLRTKDEKFWIAMGRRRALKLFREASIRIPAYKNFLKQHGIRFSTIKTFDDFEKLPITTKKNYINKYSIESRCWDGNLANSDLIAVSSGTSGEPKYWPRGDYQEFESGVIHELIYKYHFEIDRYKSLIILGFPMGVYVSGVAETIPTTMMIEKGYNATLVSVGNNKDEALKAVKRLQKHFDQVIIVGHPFFVKDVIESGKQDGINWKRNKLRMMFCSEGFNETWRRVVVKETGHKFSWENALSTYGSSELLLMAHETPMSILTRTIVEKDKDIRAKLFGSSMVPNLFQFNPMMRYIESIKKNLVFTSASGVPLIRFDIKDEGEVISHDTIEDMLHKVNPNWKKKLIKEGASAHFWQLPFVSLYGRSDYTIIFYAANIYPEHIELGLNNKAILKKITGKFTMRKDYRKNMDEFLEINIELKKGIKPSDAFAKTIQKIIVDTLLSVNSEYSDSSSHINKDMKPRIKLWPYQDAKYFKLGLKQRFIA